MRYIKIHHNGIDIYIDDLIPFAYQQLACNSIVDTIQSRPMMGKYVGIIKRVDFKELPDNFKKLSIDHGFVIKIYPKHFFEHIASRYLDVIGHVEEIYFDLQDEISKHMEEPGNFHIQCPYCKKIVEVEVKGKTKIAFKKMPNATYPVKKEEGFKDEYDEKYLCPDCYELFIMRIEF